MENQENIPEELGADGRQVLEKMALHVYRDYLETRWEWEIRLEQTRFITDRSKWDQYYTDPHTCIGRFDRETESVEIRFIYEIYEDLDEADPCRGNKLVKKCFGSFNFPEEELREIYLRKCH